MMARSCGAERRGVGPTAARALVLLLLPVMPPSETPAPEPEPEQQLGEYRLECLQGIGVEMLAASSLPAPVTDVNQAIVFPPGEHPSWNQDWMDGYLARNPEFAGPTVYDPHLPPALVFDFKRSQPPDNRTLAEYVLDGTGISWTRFKVTGVEQTAVGQLRLSGTVADFRPGGEGYVALMDFFTSLDGLCAPGDGCWGEMLRVVATHSSDRVVDGNVDANGVPTHFSTVDLEWKIHTPFDLSTQYRTPGFENRLMAINRQRGLEVGVTQPLGRSALVDALGDPYVGHEADPIYPASVALDNERGGRPDYHLPYYNTSFAFEVKVSMPCTPDLASQQMLERYDFNGDQKINHQEIIGLIREINGTVWDQTYANRWVMQADSRYFNVRNARPTNEACPDTAADFAQGCDNLLDFAELAESLPGFYQNEARCTRKVSEDLFGNPKDEYMCVPWDRCGTFPDPTKPVSSGATLEYKCGFGMCLPDYLHYGSGGVVVPDPGAFRCWDSCERAEPIKRCEHLQAAGFQVDTLSEPLSSGGKPRNTSAKIRAYAASCATDFDSTGYRSECEVMRCHYMGTALAQVCDKTGITLKPPCRSVCEAYIGQLSLPHFLPLYNSTSSDNTPADFTDCESLRPAIDRVTGKRVGQWAYYHCLATSGEGCNNFPEDDCMGPQRYAGGQPCVLGKECDSGGCPWAVPGLTSPEDEPVTSTGQDLSGHGGFCCAAGLGDCNGFGLCDDSGACHCDEWHEGIDCGVWKMATWLVNALMSCAVYITLGTIWWFRRWLRWYRVVHEAPKPPPPPKPEPIRKPARGSDTETEDEAETTDEEIEDGGQQTSPAVTYGLEEPTSIWARSRLARKKPASVHAVAAVGRLKSPFQTHSSKDDAIGRPTYGIDTVKPLVPTQSSTDDATGRRTYATDALRTPLSSHSSKDDAIGRPAYAADTSEPPLPSHSSKDDVIAAYATDAKASERTDVRVKPEPPSGKPLNPRTARFSSAIDEHEKTTLR